MGKSADNIQMLVDIDFDLKQLQYWKTKKSLKLEHDGKSS